MSSKSHYRLEYMGPRALFDPHFLPPNLIGLQKERNILKSILSDSIHDQFPLILSLYGLNGVGKTSLTRKVIQELGISQNGLKNNAEEPNLTIQSCYVNCEKKKPEEILFFLINTLSNTFDYKIDPRPIMKATMVTQMNLLTHLISKTLTKTPQSTFFFFFDSTEYMQPTLINKLKSVCASLSCSLVTSFNLLKSSPYLAEIHKSDFQIQLSTYKPSILERIISDRCELAFKSPIEINIIRYITDMVCEFDCCVPEKCIQVLRELYPIIQSNGYIADTSQIQDACRFQLKGYTINEISIAEFVSDTEIIDRLALDNICSFFQSQNRYYISYGELMYMYNIACESIDCVFERSQFHKLIKNLDRIGLMQPSNLIHNASNKTSLSNLDQEKFVYFLSISPQLFSEILDVSFGLSELD
ncbi:MAG: hypothetical protein JW776_06680 [Candidatus Lokiarchaeota archaeon]|nr:hypothetical protein [Candidatus Lokiarchaeota archaeon]